MQMGQGAWNNKGFSLIELLMATMIIMVSMLALLSSMLTTMNANRANEIRNSAIIVANQTAEALLALAFDDGELSETTATTPHSRNDGDQTQNNKGLPKANQRVRGYYFVYTVQWRVQQRSGNIKEVNIDVRYKLRPSDAKEYTYPTVIYKHKMS